MPPPSNDKESILVVTGIGSIQYLFDMLVFELFRRVDVPKHTAFKKEEPPPAQSACSELLYVSVVIIYYFDCRAPP